MLFQGPTLPFPGPSGSGGSCPKTIAVDNFDRPNGDIGSNWTSQPIATGGFGSYAVVSNQAASSSAGRNFVWWNQNPFPNDQFSQATIVDAGQADGSGLAVRMSDSSESDYLLNVRANMGQIFIDVGGSVTAPDVIFTVNNGDVIRLEVSGLTISAKVNGVVQSTVNDNSLASGHVGLWGFNVHTTGILDNWSGGCL